MDSSENIYSSIIIERVIQHPGSLPHPLKIAMYRCIVVLSCSEFKCIVPRHNNYGLFLVN